MRKTLLFFLLGVGLPMFSTSMPIATALEDNEGIVAEDEYDIRLSLKVPQVINNSTSEGYRRFKTQTIKGKMYIVWMEDGSYRLEFGGLENQQFRVGGKKVTYNGVEDRTIVYTRFNYVGDNKRNTFTTPALCFYLKLEPNYAIGGNTEDNGFYIVVSGSGSSSFSYKTCGRVAKKFTGSVAGTQGCGCSAYGHVSPTRGASIDGPSEEIDDVVASFGVWHAVWRQRSKRP